MSDQRSAIPADREASSTPETSGVATTSLVLGIASLFCLGPLTGIPALICGLIALKRIRASGAALNGKGKAVAGIVIGSIGTILITTMFLSAVSAARELARSGMCLSNLKQIGLAIAMYADEHHDRIPRRFEDLRSYAPNLDKLLICPSAKDKHHPSYEILLGGHVWQGSNEVNSIVATESWSNHGFCRNELFGDGRVEQTGRSTNSPSVNSN